ncbi:hypothetical protein OG2516_08773 [Oceanicola granulosus HTCC2516]|uniref:Uncharacterized protein n=1 Tax=Oceanicola granulosus (strain ATCC BAA-861 / DSM 15982 / KCTC 12143 / HTCC2516) TaxID=314256 RepID=Q2CAP8_OCEGH|nr:hypothetical protein OG2516_08773 [Oceanicola granulosus HTCC2516]
MRISGSSAEKGSSISRIGASVAKARARPTRCCMPPDSSPTLRSAQSERPTRLSWRSARFSRSDLLTPSSSRPSATLSRTVRQGSRPNCWNTIETHSRRRCSSSEAEAPGRVADQSSLRTVTAPRAIGLRPLMARSSVDLPDPDRPMSTRISPSSTASEQSCTPSTCRVRSWISGRSSPSSMSGRAFSGALPKTMETLSIRTAMVICGGSRR